MTVKKFADQPQDVKALREGELIASALSVALGGIVSLLIKYPLALHR